MKKFFGIFLMATAFFLVSCGGGSQPAGQDQDEETVLEQDEVVVPAPTTPPVTAPQSQQLERIEADTLIKDDQVTPPSRRGSTDSEAEKPTRRGATQETKEDTDSTTLPKRRGS